MRLTAKQITWLKVLLHLAGLLPFIWLFWAASQGQFSADPAKDIQHFTGRMALKFCWRPCSSHRWRGYAKQPLLIRTRRLLGLWCFAWATLHLTSYALLELGINNLALLGSELVTRPYLTLGIVSWLVLLALTLTSTQYAQRKTGSTLATAAQLRLSCRDPRPHSLPVVGEDFLPSAGHLRPAGRRGPFSVALQEVPPVVAIVRETVRFPQIIYQPQIFFG